MAAKVDPDAGKVKICSGHTRPICHINYSNVIDGTFWFVTSCHDSKPMLRNGETGDWVGTFEGHKGAVYGSAFNAEATRLVTGSGDYSAIVWDAVKGTQLHSWQHPHYIKSVDWWKDKILTGNYDSCLRLWDAENYAAAPLTIKAHETPIVKACYFVTEATNLFVTASENTVRLWDTRASDTTAVNEVQIPGLKVLEYTHKGDLVAAHDKCFAFYDPVKLQLKSKVVTSDDIECASLSPDGRYIAAGSKIKAKEFTIDGTELESHRGHHGPIFHIRWAPDGQTFASGSEDGMVRIWPANDIIRKLQD
jgi:serine-threonine kinase receptor-associated protein